MMTWIISAMIFLAVIFGILNGKMENVSSAAIGSCVDAVQLSLTLLGGMCLWSGVMRVAEKAELTKFISKILAPLTKLFFKGINPQGKAAQAITMNMSANLLGLGNAATPLGILAVKELAKELKTGDTAPKQMIMFVVLNTASMTIIPTTVATLRLKYGSAAPMDILPSVWIASITAITCGVLMTFVLSAVFDRKAGGRGGG